MPRHSGLKMLLSYFFFSKIHLEEEFAAHFGSLPVQVFADSGAYSAWSLGQRVDVRRYGRWLLRWRDQFAVYANLDVKGDIAAGLRNQAYLEGLGLDPLPVYHGGEPLDVLRDLVARYRYIALGGISGHHRDVKVTERWLDACFAVAQGRSVFHAFGVTTLQTLYRFPFYSADSSSWGMGFRYGNLLVFDREARKMRTIRLGQPAANARHAALLARYGLPVHLYSDRRYNTRHANAVLGALSYQRLETFLQERHGPVAFPGGGRPPGLHLYLADARTENLWKIHQGLRAYHPSTAGTFLANFPLETPCTRRTS